MSTAGQIVTPAADIHVDGWFDSEDDGEDLFRFITDNDDNTWVISMPSPDAATYVFGLAVPADFEAPDPSEPVTVRLRTRKRFNDLIQADLTVQLREGYSDETGQGTLIAERIITVTPTVTGHEIHLTPSERASITDWSNLYGRFVADQILPEGS